MIEASVHSLYSLGNNACSPFTFYALRFLSVDVCIDLYLLLVHAIAPPSYSAPFLCLYLVLSSNLRVAPGYLPVLNPQGLPASLSGDTSSSTRDSGWCARLILLLCDSVMLKCLYLELGSQVILPIINTYMY